ncbi:MAG: energy transducer TonB [Bdellovibrionota bacterium]|nr:energy transducer TonB [Bdellovibrionota bacterium]
MEKRKKSTRYKIIFAFFLSLIANYFFMFLPISEVSKRPQAFKKKPNKIKLRILPKKKAKESEKKQIVNTDDSLSKKPPKDAKFLGKSNQTFKKEVKATKVGAFKKAGLGLNKAKSLKKKQKRKIVKKKIVKVTKQKIKLSDLSLKKIRQRPLKNKVLDKKTLDSRRGQKFGSDKELGLAQNNDFLDDIPLGDMTNLNTTEYRYYGFFQRIRRKLEQYWGRSLKEKAKILFRSGRRLHAKENKVTSLTVTINKKGEIIEVFLKGRSGIKELDEAAIESFNKAGPFPNPPKGFVKNGQAKIEWGFVVKG